MSNSTSEPQERSAPEQSSLEFGAIQTQVSFLEGDILTIIDGVFSDPEQRKAVKDLVRGAFRRRIQYFRELCFDESSPRGVIVDSGIAPMDRSEQ